MRNLGLLLIVALITMSCIHKDNDSNLDKQAVTITEPVKDGVFVHITEGYNDPHRVLMPLKMANMMAKDKDVLVYMDIHAVELLVKDAKDMTHENFDSFQTYIKQLLQKEIGIYACPSCLKLKGFKLEDLMEGIKVAQKDKFFDFTKGRIITLDY